MKKPRPKNFTRRHMGGTTIVEFAVVAATLLLTIFIVIDLSRIVYLRMILEEGVRRGARLAAVCPIGDPLPRAATLLTDPAAAGAAIPGALPQNYLIQYLDEDGAVIGNPAGLQSSINFVRVSLVNVQTPLLVPFITGTFAPTNITATSSAESLGVPAVAGPIPPC